MERAPGECVLCGGTDRAPLVSDGRWTVFKCTGCGLGVLDPLGIPFKTLELREDLFPPGSLDVVTMWHALEHMTDPRVPLDLARKWLSPDGGTSVAFVAKKSAGADVAGGNAPSK